MGVFSSRRKRADDSVCLQELRHVKMEIVRVQNGNQNELQTIGRLRISEDDSLDIDIRDAVLSESCNETFSMRHPQDIGGKEDDVFWDGSLSVDPAIPSSVIASFYYGNSYGVLSVGARGVTGEILKKYGAISRLAE